MTSIARPERAIADDERPFVRVVDGRFRVGDEPFRFLGANASVMHGPVSRHAVDEVFDAIADDGLRVVRVWALGEAPDPSPAYVRDYVFRVGEEGWIETSFAHLDRVLVAAARRNLRVVVVLANRWKDYGGFVQYARWAGEPETFDANGNVRSTELDVLYDSERFRALYRAHVERIVARTNALSGVAYRDDPTILAWELVNESSASTARGADSLVAFTDEMARFVHALDPNHLVSAGHIGYELERERRLWERVVSLPSIDYADVHAYPLGDDRVANVASLRTWLDDRITLAHAVVRKPLVFGELGFDGARIGPDWRTPEAWTRVLLSHLERRGVAGAMVWIYEPSAAPARAFSILASTHRLAHGAGVRRALRRAVGRLDSARPPAIALLTPRAAAPIFSVRGRLEGSIPPTVAWTIDEGGTMLAIDPLAFTIARFENAGVYDGGARLQFWGAGEGSIDYAVPRPPRVPRRLVVRANVSSELEGDGRGAGPGDGGEVSVRLDGIEIGRAPVVTDDGEGRPVEFVVTDRRFLRRIFRRRAYDHRLTFVARGDVGAGGLCIYGPRTDGSVVPGVPDRIEIVLE